MTGPALVPAEKFAVAVLGEEHLPKVRDEDFRAFKYSPMLNCVFIQRGMNVLILPAFQRPDGSVFIDKELGFKSIAKVLGPEKMALIRETLGDQP